MGHLTWSPSEVVLPVAIARPHEAGEYGIALRGSVDRWARARWRFLSPRLVPAALALAGMVAVLAALDVMAGYCRLEPRGNGIIYLIGDAPPPGEL